jgi:hypothetical protein
MFPSTETSPQVRAGFRAAMWHAVDRAVAFVTLDAYGVEGPHAAVDAPVAARASEPLKAPHASRRPAPAPPAQHCATPLTAPPRCRPHAVPARTTSPARRHGIC